MDLLTEWLRQLVPFAPAATAAVVLAALFATAQWLHARHSVLAFRRRLSHQLFLLVLVFVGLGVVLLALPMSESLRSDVLGLLGVVLSAAVALAATTFIGNILAGLLLGSTRAFRAGDFIRVGEHFGRVSERGLFHIEIQTEDSELTTLPNLFVATHPVTVVRRTGTLVSASVSLGYDVPAREIEAALVAATEAAGLEKGFVRLDALGDFSITYRACGVLSEVESLLSARTKLRRAMLDALHGAGIEIVSPTFMNTRAFPPERAFVPVPAVETSAETAVAESDPDRVVFDKADEAATLEKLVELHESLGKQLDGEKDETRRTALQERRERVAELIERRRERESEE